MDTAGLVLLIAVVMLAVITLWAGALVATVIMRTRAAPLPQSLPPQPSTFSSLPRLAFR